MTLLKHIWILTVDEILQLVLRRRALFALALYAVVIGLVIYGFSKVDQTVTDYIAQRGLPKVRGDEILNQFGDFPGRDTAERVMSWPITFPLFQFFAIFWMSELIAIVSCDMISRDRERGALRFLFLRTTRSALYCAKFLAHLLLYLVVHTLSLVCLAITNVMRSDSLTFQECIEPLIAYSWGLAPLIALALAMTLFASSVSGSIVSSLLKIHFLWIPVFFLFSYGFHELISWKSWLGIFAPFQEFASANIIGNLFVATLFFGLGFLLFRRAEV